MDAPVPALPSHQLLVFLCQTGLLLMLALVLGRVAARLGLPAVVGELCAGIVVGPSVLQHISPDVAQRIFPPDAAQFHLLDVVGQLGVLLLVGITGTHLDLDLVRTKARASVIVSALGLIVPLGLGVGVGLLLPAHLLSATSERHVFALFLGVALCVSAIPVIAKTLIDMDLVHRDIGQLTLTAAMVDDAVGWLLLSMVAAMAAGGIDPRTILVSVGALLGTLAFAVIVGRPLARLLFRAADRSGEPGVTAALATSLILLSAAATHALGLEAIFGAFICGILISQYGKPKAGAIAPLHTIVLGVLAPLFFATAGLRMDLGALMRPEVAAMGAVVLVVAIVGKFVGAYLGARLSRLGNWEALALGAAMNARGVIEIIVAMTGLRLGVLNTEAFTIIVLVAVVTSLMAPPLLRAAMSRVPVTTSENQRQEAATSALSGYRSA